MGDNPICESQPCVYIWYGVNDHLPFMRDRSPGQLLVYLVLTKPNVLLEIPLKGCLVVERVYLQLWVFVALGYWTIVHVGPE